MSGPTEFHGARLLAAIVEIETLCEDALSQGHAPLLDAVETAKLLRALVSGAAEYSSNVELVRKRADLARSRGSIIYALPIAWMTIVTADDVGAEGDES